MNVADATSREPSSRRRGRGSRAFTDRSALVLAAGVAGAAWWAQPVPLLVAAAVALAGLLRRAPWLVALGLWLLTSALAAHAQVAAWPTPAGTLQAVCVLVADPAPRGSAIVAVVRDPDGRHLEVRARGPSASALRDRLAGEEVFVDGSVQPRRLEESYLLWRHVTGTVTPTRVALVGEGNAARRAANAFRRVLERGAASMRPEERALYTGLVYGDDRAEPAEVVDDFRGAGLSHLLAVSGENVAFVLLAAQPLVRRVARRGRFAVSIAVLAAFVLVTRAEPSVLRATAMATIAVWATTSGRIVSSRRALALAVTALVVLDPFLVHVVGFQLSVLASLGIAVLARPLHAHLLGPRWLRDVLAVSLAAQAGVLPVLLMMGPVPVLGVVANVLAVPAAGQVMVWGLTGGLLAGVVGGPVAAGLHVPTRLLLWWIALIARGIGRLPVGPLHVVHAAIVGIGVASAWGASRWRPARRAWCRTRAAVMATGTAAALAAVVLAALARPAVAGTRHALGPGAEVVVGGDGTVALVVDGRADLEAVIKGLRALLVDHIAVIVARSSGAATVATVAALEARYAPATVIAARGAAAQPAVGPHLAELVEEVDAPTLRRVGGLWIDITDAGPPLRVEVRDTG